MIQHTVVFKLKYPKGSAEEKTFLEAANKLSTLPGVQNFECLRQISKKNNFDYGLSMVFNGTKEYDAYNNHSDHIAFVETFWLRDVVDFMEIDYEGIRFRSLYVL
jgi:heme-degrading monooxygenase HmoA